MLTKFEEIVDVTAIGKVRNQVMPAELLALAARENFAPAYRDKEKTLLLAVDIQNDFMEGGTLGVQGSLGDVRRLTRYVYDNMESITAIAATCDCHSPMQIFHACWWRDENGHEPEPFTVITLEDLKRGRYTPQMMPEKSAEYLEALERQGRKQLCIWPYHCFEASAGGALETQFSNIANFFSAARRAEFRKFGKGRIPYSEFYGAFYPEFREAGTDNRELFNFVAGFDKIVIAGEAMDYCVYETARQLCGEFARARKNCEISLLCDCTSSIGSRVAAEMQFDELERTYGIKLLTASGN